MAKARMASDSKTSIKALVYGDFGSRKSGTVVDFAKMKKEDGSPMRVLYLDCETGSIEGFHLRRLKDEGVDLRNIYIVYTTLYEELNQYVSKVINKEDFYVLDDDGNETDKIVLDAEGKPFKPDAVVIDGITVVADNVKDAMISVSEIRAGIKADLKDKTSKEKMVDVAVAGMEFKDWDKHKSKGKSLVRKLINSTDVHVGITARSKKEKEMKRDSSGSMVAIPTGREILESWDFISYEVNVVIHNKVDEDGNCYGIIENKDRTGMFKQGEVLKNPSLSLWQSIIDDNKGKEESISMKQDTYEKSMEKEVESQLKTENKPLSMQSPDELKLAIQTALAELKPDNKKIVAQKIKDKGLTTQYTTIDDVNKLKEILTVIKGE